MTELIVVRHGISQGNKKRIIQGRREYALSHEGIENVKKISDNLLFEGINTIFSSPLKRARKTAEIIAKKKNAQVITDNVLVEVDCGKLQGLSHIQAKKRYPVFYDEYIRRKDLDNVSGAEKGEELQSRVLVFLERFLNRKKRKGIVVSHAGFIRCLINTSLNRLRTLPVNMEHSKIHTVHPWKNIEAEPLSKAKNSKAYKIATWDKTYIMKIFSHEDVERALIIQQISKRLWSSQMLTPRVIVFESRCNLSGDPYNIQVLDYLEGKHIYGRLETKKTVALINAIGKIHLNLVGMSSDFEPQIVGTFAEKFEQSFHSISDSEVKHLGGSILSDPRKMALLACLDKILVDYDLHRSNLLFHENEVKKIDLDCMVFGPRELQLASLIVSGILLEDKDFDIMRAVRMWPYEIELEKLKVLMLARAFMGSAFFQRAIETGQKNPENFQLLKRYNEIAYKVRNWSSRDNPNFNYI